MTIENEQVLFQFMADHLRITQALVNNYIKVVETTPSAAIDPELLAMREPTRLLVEQIQEHLEGVKKRLAEGPR